MIQDLFKELEREVDQKKADTISAQIQNPTVKVKPAEVSKATTSSSVEDDLSKWLSN